MPHPAARLDGPAGSLVAEPRQGLVHALDNIFRSVVRVQGRPLGRFILLLGKELLQLGAQRGPSVFITLFVGPLLVAPLLLRENAVGQFGSAPTDIPDQRRLLFLGGRPVFFLQGLENADSLDILPGLGGGPARAQLIRCGDVIIYRLDRNSVRSRVVCSLATLFACSRLCILAIVSFGRLLDIS